MINMENLTSFTSGQTEPLEVDVYRNLHRACYSIKDRSTNRVIPHDLWCDGTHTAPVVVQNVTFKVLEGGRLRVVESGIKNVHAFVRGTWDPTTTQTPAAGPVQAVFMFGSDGNIKTSSEAVSYNPFAGGYLYSKLDRRPVKTADKVTLSSGGAVHADGLE